MESDRTDHPQREAATGGQLRPLQPTLAPAAEQPAPRKKRRPFVMLALVAAVIGLGIGTYMILTRGEESTDDAQVAADTVPVATRVSGAVIAVPVTENQEVKKGDLIVQIDDADYIAREQEAEAQLATAQAQAQAADSQVAVVEASSRGGLRSAKAMVTGSSVGVDSAEAQVAAARAGLLRAQAEVSKANIDLRRAQELRAANAVPEEQLDNARVAHESATAQLAQARAQLSIAQEGRNAAESRVAEARGHLNQSSPIDQQIATATAQAALQHARVKAAQAALDLAKLQLSYTKIYAPTDGSASKLSVHPGQLVAVGQTLIELVPNHTYVVANFKETQIGQMRPGQRAEITIDAFSGRTLQGRLQSLSGGTGASFSLLPADNASGNFVKVVQRVPVRIEWDHPPTELHLRAGLSADVTVYTGK